MRVTFDGDQMEYAAAMGCKRRIRAMQLGRRPLYGVEDKDDLWDKDICSAGGEYAVCLYFRLRWITETEQLRINGVKIADGVGTSGREVEVRSCRDHERRLIVHPADMDWRAFVLVTGSLPTYYIQGWMEGREAKREEWWEDPSGKSRWAYFAPQAALRAPETLPEWLRKGLT